MATIAGGILIALIPIALIYFGLAVLQENRATGLGASILALGVIIGIVIVLAGLA